MTAKELYEFLTQKMSMTEVYQPVIVKELLLHGGERSKDQLAAALIQYDRYGRPYLEYYRKVVMRWPKITLSKHGVICYERKGQRFILNCGSVSEEETQRMVDICDSKIQAWLQSKEASRETPQSKTGGIERKPSPQEEEYEDRLKELAAQEEILADLELENATFLRQQNDFYLEYLRVVGVKYAQLDEINAQIAAFLASQIPVGTEDWQEANARFEKASGRAEESRKETDEGIEKERKREKAEPTEELKRLFKEACLKFHPDKARNKEERERFTRIMAELNAAFDAGDIEKIRAIINGEHGADEKIDESLIKKLARIVKQLLQVEGAIAAVKQRIEYLKSGWIWRLRERVLEAKRHGDDLLAELAWNLEGKIKAAREDLRRVQESNSSESAGWDYDEHEIPEEQSEVPEEQSEVPEAKLVELESKLEQLMESLSEVLENVNEVREEIRQLREDDFREEDGREYEEEDEYYPDDDTVDWEGNPMFDEEGRRVDITGEPIDDPPHTLDAESDYDDHDPDEESVPDEAEDVPF